MNLPFSSVFWMCVSYDVSFYLYFWCCLYCFSHFLCFEMHSKHIDFIKFFVVQIRKIIHYWAEEKRYEYFERKSKSILVKECLLCNWMSCFMFFNSKFHNICYFHLMLKDLGMTMQTIHYVVTSFSFLSIYDCMI